MTDKSPHPVGGLAGAPAVSPSESDTNLTSRRARWQAKALDARTCEVLAEDERHFLRQSVSTPCLNVITRAEGIHIWDAQGRRYMDFHGNNVHHVGYGHPRVKAAIVEAMNGLPFAPRRYTCETSIRLAEKLGQISPGDLSKCLFTTGGSDAVEVAVRIARAATGRFKTLSFWDAFHGAGTGASALSGEMLFRSGPAAPMVAGAEHVAPFACYRCAYGYKTDAAGNPPLDLCQTACARMVDYVLSREGDVACVVAEPARAVPYIPPPGFWKIVREACDRHGAMLIFDEIPTGLGKTGKMFAAEHDGVVPDILVMGKALGGGILPIAAVIAREGLDVAQDWAFGHYTHEKNPVTAAAALATIAVIEEEGLVGNAARIGAVALERMEAMKARHSVIGDVRGRGLLLGIDLVQDAKSRTPAPDLAEAVLYRALDAGLSFKTTMGNALTFTPPLTVTESQMLEALDIVDQALAAEAA